MLVPKKEPAHPRAVNPQEVVAKKGYLTNQGQDFPSGRMHHIAAFLRAVHPDPNHCEDCKNRNELATMLENPGSEY